MAAHCATTAIETSRPAGADTSSFELVSFGVEPGRKARADRLVPVRSVSIFLAPRGVLGHRRSRSSAKIFPPRAA